MKADQRGEWEPEPSCTCGHQRDDHWRDHECKLHGCRCNIYQPAYVVERGVLTVRRKS